MRRLLANKITDLWDFTCKRSYSPGAVLGKKRTRPMWEWLHRHISVPLYNRTSKWADHNRTTLHKTYETYGRVERQMTHRRRRRMDGGQRWDRT